MVYIDHVHLVADTLEELHKFAESIGLKIKWLQGYRKGHAHYDVLGDKYKKAIAAGAVRVSPREVLKKSKAITIKGKLSKNIVGIGKNKKLYGTAGQTVWLISRAHVNMWIVAGDGDYFFIHESCFLPYTQSVNVEAPKPVSQPLPVKKSIPARTIKKIVPPSMQTTLF